MITRALCLILCITPSMSWAQAWPDGAPNRPGIAPAFHGQTEAPAETTNPAPTLSVIADGLDTPWAVTVLPGAAGYLVTERDGRLRHVGGDGLISPPISGLPDIVAQRQGGLLDIALSPDFDRSAALYITYSAPDGIGRSATAAARARLSDDRMQLLDVVEIFRQSPAATAPGHYGSRIEPLPDGSLALTTGDRMRHPERAQDPTTGYGAVIRIMPDGSPPNEPPSVADALPGLVSYGHRNIQGIAHDPATGQLWTLEHGPAGGDELNLITPGGNYGWPVVSYGVNYNGREIGQGRAAHTPDFMPPRYYWDPVIAPGGMVIYDGDMFPAWRGDILAAGLVAQAVVRLDLAGDRVIAEERLAEGIGRVRDIAVDHDGAILFVTDEGPRSRLMRLSR